MTARAWIFSTIAAVLGITGASCLVDGFELVPSASGGGGGAGAGAGGAAEGGAGGSGGCTSATWPDPPPQPDPGVDDVDFVAAIRSIDFGEGAPDLSEEGPRVGYDLDGRCTCRGAGSSCQRPAFATATDCDGPGGVDNAGARLFALVAPFAKDLSSAYQSELADKGGWSLLVRVSEYNGKANDSAVRTALYPSPGIEADPCWPPGMAPVWDGNDPWPIDVASLEDPAGGAGGGAGGDPGACEGVLGYDYDKPRYVDTKAYVTGGVLVASLPELGLVLSGDTKTTVVKLTAGFATGRLQKSAVGWRITDGVLAGRWPTKEIFAAIGGLVSNGGPVCTDDGVYSALKQKACTFVDIASALGGPTTECDALSLAMGFQAEPAKLGIAWQRTASVSPCPPETNPENDSCGN